jgi:hypothetical protein
MWPQATRLCAMWARHAISSPPVGARGWASIATPTPPPVRYPAWCRAGTSIGHRLKTPPRLAAGHAPSMGVRVIRTRLVTAVPPVGHSTAHPGSCIHHLFRNPD